MAKLSKRALKARAEFRKAYGRTAFNIVDAIVRGWSNQRIRNKYKVATTSIAAFRANVTRGTYYPYIMTGRQARRSGGTMYY